MAPTPAQSRLVDPLLTEHARGYTNAEFIGHRVLPVVDVPVRGVKRIAFGKEDFRIMNTKRAPGAEAKAITFGREAEPVALTQDALDALVPRENLEESARVPGIDEAAEAVNGVLRIVDLGHEAEIAALVQNPANYAAGSKLTLSGTDRWSDVTSKPGTVVGDAKLAVAARIGRQPNVMTIGAVTFKALQNNVSIQDRFKFTSADSVTEAMLARFFDLEEVIVGRAVALPEGAPDTADAAFLWGNFAQLAYVNKAKSYRQPGFGYSYRLKGYPIVEKPYWDAPRRSWRYGVTQERSPVIAGADAGYLISNI